ncbi:uncharacterized protein [Henckelia pumila]|uniref:uncharacterized protein n=1 Tax=Henckelia pumila TaxID=405737 RepID=UPI003C6E6874
MRASFDDENNRCEIGGIVRDQKGQPLAAFGNNLLMPGSVVLGELISIKAGLEFLREKKLNQVLIASDSLLAVQAVTEPNGDLNYVGLCVSEINTLILGLDIVSLFHVKRSVNAVEHSLAKFSSSFTTFFCWVSGSFSRWLVKLVITDISSIQ